MFYLKLVASILAAVVFGGKLEEQVNKFLKPSDDFMIKVSHYGSSAGVGVGTYMLLNAFLGSK